MTHIYKALFLVALFFALAPAASASSGYSRYSGSQYYGSYYYPQQVVTTPYWCGSFWSSLPCQNMYYQAPTYNYYQYPYQSYYSYNPSSYGDNDRRHDRSRDDDRNNRWWSRW